MKYNTVQEILQMNLIYTCIADLGNYKILINDMINTTRERIAIYDTAKIFTEIGWFFREQPTMDFGIDALVETSIDSRPNGVFFALQIKGGDSNFEKNKSGLTFYFDDIHKQYWMELSKTFPVFIILKESNNNKIYWQLINKETISKTTKHWKLNIPITNELTMESRRDFNNILKIHYQTNSNLIENQYNVSDIKKHSDSLDLNIVYENSNFIGVICLIKMGNDNYKLNFSFHPKDDEWDKTKNEISWTSPYSFIIHELENYITTTYYNFGKSDRKIGTINAISQIIEPLLKKGGLYELNEFLFNYKNRRNSVPKYCSFLEAFEFYKENDSIDYKIKISDHSLYFQTEKEDFIMDTYEGKIEELKCLIKNVLLDEIYAFTNKQYWSDIFLEARIEKEIFIPKMLEYWERYWENLYNEIREEVGTTKHLDILKEQSWRQFKIFSDGYSNAEDIIEYASGFGNMVMYPLAVVTFIRILNAKECYQEYCEYEFENLEWASISVDDDNPNCPIFYIKVLEEKL